MANLADVMDSATPAENNMSEVASLLAQVDLSTTQATLQGSNALGLEQRTCSAAACTGMTGVVGNYTDPNTNYIL